MARVVTLASARCRKGAGISIGGLAVDLATLPSTLHEAGYPVNMFQWSG
jgi:hypothetical protein